MNKIVVTVFVFLFFSVPVFSDQFSLFLENDTIYHTDHDYTHGTRIEYYNASNDIRVAIGQNIYTPDNKEAKYLIPNDRPYAGYLYASVFDTVYLKHNAEFFIECQIGMTGPYSYAEEVQTWIHEQLHNKIPQGWANQIPNHFASLIIGKYTIHAYENKYFAVDPYAGASMGNLADHIDAGLNVYAGYNIPPSRNSHVIPYKVIMRENWNPYAYIYAGIEPKLMLYNMLLEDHKFSIHPELFVYDRNLGLVLGCRYFELAFTLCYRSKEFEEQPQAEKFGSAQITVNF